MKLKIVVRKLLILSCIIKVIFLRENSLPITVISLIHMCVCAAVLCCIQLFFLREFEVKRSVLQNKTKSPRQNFHSAFCLGENADFYQVFFKVESWWTRALQNFEKSSHWSDFWTDWQITQLSQPIKRLQNSKKGKKMLFWRVFWKYFDQCTLLLFF